MLVLLYAAIPLFILVLAILGDIRSHRGYCLVLLALVVAALDGWLVLSVWQASQTPTDGNDLKGLGEALALFAALCLSFLIALDGLIVAAVSRQWGWFVGVVASLVPLLALAIDGMLPTGAPPDVRNSPQVRAVVLVLALLCPLVLGVVYGMSRIIHPNARI